MKHTVHPLIVHFPIACWSLSTLGDLTSNLFTIGQSQLIVILMSIGCISAVAAMAAGLYDLSKVEASERIETIVDRHMYAAVTAWGFYTLSLYLRWENGIFTEPNVWAIVTSVIGFFSLMTAGWFGATLVYDYGVGSNKAAK